jgi:predicted SprT family Zn-dependent metalloprotease
MKGIKKRVNNLYCSLSEPNSTRVNLSRRLMKSVAAVFPSKKEIRLNRRWVEEHGNDEWKEILLECNSIIARQENKICYIQLEEV